MVDTEKCFKQKLYDSKRDIRRQRQDTILVMLESVTHVLEHVRKKEGTRSHTFVLVESIDRKLSA